MKLALRSSVIFLILTFVNLSLIFSYQRPFDNFEWFFKLKIVVPVGISILLYFFATYRYSKNLHIKTTFGFILYSFKAIVSPIFFTVLLYPAESSLLLKVLVLQLLPLVLTDLWYLREVRNRSK
ncbi:hypothetical protein [Aureibacter tunicatorum]|uniref:Uncharacterized protein n=1 Tax=Aureibacter tunicatorum TaxID=866807 RepID=A0AAE4BRC0_9BACT|nr:hypothetical protein [Aureibacter tunicatorum]MDR6237793.1 hypothetical protein [Aureibacter tunicatorum]BDD02828.1 hypothetical protein AUTU_03110 [Aureibacter tunicatorum]